MIAKSILNKAFQVNRQQQCSIRIWSFRSWLVPEICDNQLCISNQNFSINYSTTNLKQASLGTLHYKNVSQKLFKQNYQVNKQQQWSIRIRSFWSWLLPEIRDNQHFISNHNSITNLNIATQRTFAKRVSNKAYQDNQKTTTF